MRAVPSHPMGNPIPMDKPENWHYIILILLFYQITALGEIQLQNNTNTKNGRRRIWKFKFNNHTLA